MSGLNLINKWFISRGIEVLPQGWQKVCFGDLVSKSEYGLGGNSGDIGPFPFLKMNNLKDGSLNLEKVDQIHVSKKDFDSHQLKIGDLLFNRTNSAALVGKACVWDKEEPAFAASYLVRFKINEKANPYYLNYWWQTSYAKSRLSVLATIGVQQCNINQTELQKSFFIPLPPRHEQDIIIETLQNWEQATNQLNQLIKEKKLYRRSLTQQLLGGKRRLPDFSSEWQEVRLGDIFTNRTESGQLGLPLVAITANRGVVPRDDIGRKDSSSKAKDKYLRICPGDIGYNTMRMWQGVSGLSTLEGIVSPAYTIATPQKHIDGKFMAILFKFPPVVHLFYRYSQGLVSDTWNLKYRSFAKIKVTIPEEKEQKAIAKVFETIDQEIELLQSKAEALRLQKSGLMQRLLTGKTRVS